MRYLLVNIEIMGNQDACVMNGAQLCMKAFLSIGCFFTLMSFGTNYARPPAGCAPSKSCAAWQNREPANISNHTKDL
jgi:hypothetical protein